MNCFVTGRRISYIWQAYKTYLVIVLCIYNSMYSHLWYTFKKSHENRAKSHEKSHEYLANHDF